MLTQLPLTVVALMALGEAPVRVELDMDAGAPGIQTTILVEPGTTLVEGVAVYIYDPLATRRAYGIGYLGGINRGISLGHNPGDNTGTVVALSGETRTPINPGNDAWIDLDGAIQKAFLGPEIQYTEFGAPGDAPLPVAPEHPVLVATIRLQNASPGDTFEIALADNVVLWTGGESGAFSTIAHFSLDTGGDAAPDGTPTVDGPDADASIPAPPAAYLVDYVDGGHAPATIRVRCPSDFNRDGVVSTLDVLAFLNAWAAHDPAGDFNGDGLLDTRDVIAFLSAWSTGC